MMVEKKCYSQFLCNEIIEVIGAGGNSFSAIRINMGRRRVATNQDLYLLSALDPTPIEIIQTNDGSLSVYIPGHKSEPLLNFTDASPLEINYVSFSTFGMVAAKWYFDCQFDGFAHEIEKEVRNSTPYQQLLTNIVTKGENKTIPFTLKSVNFAFQLCSASFLQDSSILKTRLNLILYWHDDVFEWNPEDYSNISLVKQENLDIWSPRIVLLNGALRSSGELQLQKEIKVFANGNVTMLATNVELTTWCYNSARNWPYEQINCELDFGLMDLTVTTEHPILLSYDRSRPLDNDTFESFSEWQFKKVQITAISKNIFGRISDAGLLQLIDGDVAINLSLIRNTSFYKMVFTIPIYATNLLILLSFFLRGYRRGAILLVVFVIVSLDMMFLTKHAPFSYQANLMIAYKVIMRISTFCYVLHIMTTWFDLYPPKQKPSEWLMLTVNSSILRLLLCMRYSDSSEYIEIQTNPWRELGKILNTISCLVINIILIFTSIFLL